MAFFTCDQLIEALEKNRGFIHASQRYMFKTWGIKADERTIKKKISEWGMKDWLDDIRKTLVEDCLQKTFHKGIADGDNHCIFWVLTKYAHHIDFLPEKNDDQSETKSKLDEILAYAKRVPEQYTKTEPSGEHSET